MSASFELTTAPVVRRLGLHTGRVVPVVCGLIVVLMVLLALFGPLLAPYDPTAPDQSFAYVGSIPGHPLGFDGQGRDLVSRLLAGARTAVLAPAVIAVSAVTAGSILAVVAAWAGGWFDAIISSALDLALSFPGMLLAILAAAIFGSGVTAPVIALALAYSPYVARVVRSAAMRERARDYVVACELQGLSAVTICLRHLVPNIAPVVVAQGTLVFGYAIADFAAVSYLGLGVQPPAPDWGAMVADGQVGLLQGYPMESLAAGTLIVIVVLAVNILGEWMVDAKEPGR
ncbi:ABC transporter permease [Nocardioides hungaricus]